MFKWVYPAVLITLLSIPAGAQDQSGNQEGSGQQNGQNADAESGEGSQGGGENAGQGGQGSGGQDGQGGDQQQQNGQNAGQQQNGQDGGQQQGGQGSGQQQNAQGQQGDQNQGGGDIPVPEGFEEVALEDVRTDLLRGARVYGANNSWIGEVSELMVENETVSQVIVDVGGFLGVGEKPVALDIGALRVLRNTEEEELRLYTPRTQDDLASMPRYEDG